MYMFKSQKAQALRCRPRGEASQRSSHSLQAFRICQHKILSGMPEKWEQFGAVQASYGCLLDHVCMGVRISVFDPQFCNALISVLNSMQMDAELKKEQIGTLFVWVRALKVLFLGGGVPQGCPPQKVNVPSKKQTVSCWSPL